MKKSLTCMRCRKKFVVWGETGRAQERPQTVTCPHCQAPNRMMWPSNANFQVERPEAK